MKGARLEVSYYKGRPLAAYYYLPRHGSEPSHRTVVAAPGLIVDFDRVGRPIGVEILDPHGVSAAALNKVLRSLGCDAMTREELESLRAA